MRFKDPAIKGAQMAPRGVVMKFLRKSLLLIATLPLLSFASMYSSNVYGDARSNEQIERNQGDQLRNDGRYQNNGNFEGGVVYPGYGYPAGGYLYPGVVDPGEDEADAIYRANQHSGE